MILVVGSINMDICLDVRDIPKPGETILSNGMTKNPGGKGANQAVAAAKLGAEVTMLGCVGEDEHGTALLKSLSDAGVDTQYILRNKQCPSSCAYICVAQSGENSIVVDPSANSAVSSEYLLQHEQLFEKAEFCIMQMEIPVETVKTAVQLCQKHKVKVALNPSPLSSFDPSVLHGVSCLVPNEAEASALLGKAFAQAGREELSVFMKEYGIEHLIVTLGKKGCSSYREDEPDIHVQASPRKAVDTTGAGDTFLGAVITALSRGMDTKDALVFANAASGIAVTRRGAQQAMPTAQEVANELQNYSS